MATFANVADLGTLPIWPGVLARVVEGREMTLAVVELAPNSVVAAHEHPNEQLGVVLQGSMTFTIGGERRDLVAGDTYNIPANVRHDAVTGPRGAVVVDVFAPVRSDWKRFAATPPQSPAWP
jgi:quercetin dioxygenase-like cupin family protein